MAALSKDILEVAKKPWFPVMMKELGYEKIIRCKDCKYNPNNPRPYADNDPVEMYFHCEYMGENDWCSKAKRRTRMSDKLKPCPFCGGEMIVSGSSRLRRFTISHKNLRNCYFYSFEIDWKPVGSLAEAIKAWNRRASEDETD